MQPIIEQTSINESTQIEATEGTEATQAENLSPKFAQLARKEQSLRQKDLELKDRERRLAEKENEYKTNYIRKDELKNKFSTDFNSAAEELDLSYDQLTQAVLNQPSQETQAFRALEKKISALEAQLEAKEKSQVEQQTQAYQRAIENIRAEATQLIETDQEFETVKTMGRVEDIVEHIEKTYKETGKVLKVSEAAKVIEDKLLEDALKVAKLKKVQEKLTPQQEQAIDPKAKVTPGSKTLTNNLTTNRKLTARERAILAFEGKL